MKNIKNFFAIAFMVLIGWLSIQFPESRILLIVGVLLFLILVFNFSVRKRIQFKPYFTNPWNLLVSAHDSKSETEIPSDLMFEKMLEVLTNSSYKIQNSNAEEKSIFVTTPMSFRSWGENIYIDLEETKLGKTTINVNSIALQLYSWGKNKENFNTLILEIEESLTI